ncbi:OprD family outer membrane porin [uncultured Endozoicomonas sp.]|uniref:OprD family outer membrane porin n=1 Tax=uncultured Endozoicomonas sp. TaxID=432652 RepID=UPI00262FFB0D|nr:OprD family outer membrane porin [uncultured Endozoicomonas sp.]
MKTLAKSVLGVAVAAAVASTSVQAAEEIVTIDPSLTFTYKNYYWDNTAKDTGDKDTSEWAHGLIADFDTGYVNDLVGAVVTAGYAGALDNDGSFSNVAEGSNGKDGNDVTGFQQAYLKAKTTFSGVDFAGSVGVKKRGTETYSDSGSRILAASSNGYDLSAGFGGANVYFTEITGVSQRNESAFSNSVDEELKILGANYSYEGLGLAAEFGKVNEGLEQSFLKASYGFDLDDNSSIDLDARYGKAESDKSGDNYESKYYNLNAAYNFGSAYVGLGYNITSDDDFETDYLGGSSNDKFNSSLAQWENYALEDEKAYVVSAGYNFADQGLEGLSWDLWYAKGKDAKDVADFKRREYGSYLSYAFDGSLEGLSLAWLHINYRAEGTAEGERAAAANQNLGTIYNTNVDRFFLTYSVSVF